MDLFKDETRWLVSACIQCWGRLGLSCLSRRAINIESVGTGKWLTLTTVVCVLSQQPATHLGLHGDPGQDSQGALCTELL